MGKFDGILLCTDLDGTLLTDDKQISTENKNAIAYFMSQGGLFTFATGRIPQGIRHIVSQVMPNVPIVCCNGAGIYDLKTNKMLWSQYLDQEAVRVVEFIDRSFPFSGIEIVNREHLYFCKMNDIVLEHKRLEQLPDFHADYHDVEMPWTKVLFMQNEEQLPFVKNALLSSPFADRYEFVQSSPYYYELLPKDATKGMALKRLAQMLRIPVHNVIAAGDNENDISLLKMAGTGIAVANAMQEVKNIADFITVDNNSHAISAIIYHLNNGLFTDQMVG